MMTDAFSLPRVLGLLKPVNDVDEIKTTYQKLDQAYQLLTTQSMVGVQIKIEEGSLKDLTRQLDLLSNRARTSGHPDQQTLLSVLCDLEQAISMPPVRMERLEAFLNRPLPKDLSLPEPTLDSSRFMCHLNHLDFKVEPSHDELTTTKPSPAPPLSVNMNFWELNAELSRTQPQFIPAEPWKLFAFVAERRRSGLLDFFIREVVLYLGFSLVLSPQFGQPPYVLRSWCSTCQRNCQCLRPPRISSVVIAAFNRHSLHADMNQLLRYLKYNDYQYGILTSYQDWFFVRHDQGRFTCHPPISFDSSAPTILQCIYALLEVTPCGSAVQQLASAPSKNQSSPVSSIPSEPKCSLVPPLPLSWPSFEILDLNIQLLSVLGRGRIGTTFLADVNNVRMALKVGDVERSPYVEQELKHEWHMYQSLKNLQGKVIPRVLLSYRSIPGFVLFGTQVIRKHPRNHWTFPQALSALKSIHQQGVIHGDVRCENILLDEHNQVFFIDFGIAEEIAPKTEHTEAIQEDEENLKQVVTECSKYNKHNHS